MEFKRTKISDVIVCQPQIFGDERGCFFESFNQVLLKVLLVIKLIFVKIMSQNLPMEF